MNTNDLATHPAPCAAPPETGSIVARSWATAALMAFSIGAFLFRILRKFHEDALANGPGYSPADIALAEDIVLAGVHLGAAALLLGLTGTPRPLHTTGRAFAAGACLALSVTLTLPWLMWTGSPSGVHPINLRSPLHAHSDAGIFSTPLVLAAIAAFCWAAVRGDRRANTAGLFMASCAVATAGLLSLTPNHASQHLGPGWWLAVAVIVTTSGAGWVRKHPIRDWNPRKYVSPNSMSWLSYGFVSMVFLHALRIPAPEPATFVLDTSGIERALQATVVLYHCTIGIGLLIASMTRGTWMRWWIVSGALLPILAISRAILLDG